MLSIFPEHDSFQLLSTNNQIIGAIMLDTGLFLSKGCCGGGVVSHSRQPLHFQHLLIKSMPSPLNQSGGIPKAPSHSQECDSLKTSFFKV